MKKDLIADQVTEEANQLVCLNATLLLRNLVS